jgi:sirohydrochlorin cobaltochelatase
MALDGPLTVRGGRTIKYCEPVGSHARMTDVLLRRAAEVLNDLPREKTSLLIVGHGTERDANSSTAVEKQVALLRARAEFAEVAGAFIDQAPLVSDWEKWTTKPRVVVVPFFIADGPHVSGDIPSLLGIVGDPFSHVHRVRGREIFYTHAVGTEPMIADAILDQVAAFDAR